MSLSILAGQKEKVGKFILDQIPDISTLPGGFEAVGITRNGRLVGGCLYTNYVPCKGGGDVQLWAAGHGWVSRRVIRSLVGYPFRQLGCHRVTVIIAKKNKASRRLVEGIGFKLEGTARHGIRPGVDACLYGYLKHEFEERWSYGGIF